MSRLEELMRELCPDGVEYKKLGEIATDIYRGSGIKREQVTLTGTPCIRYGEIYTTYGIWFDKCVSHTDAAAISSPKYFEYGDILFAITGESVEDIAKSTVYVGHERCLAGGDIVVLKHEQDPKYLSYALATTEARTQKSSGKVKSKVVHSSVPAIKALVIPVPPLPVQREIVRILDNFTELATELAAELAARKKQYQCYRKQLLTTYAKMRKYRLGDICSLQEGYMFPKNEMGTKGIPIVRTSDLQNGMVDITSAVRYAGDADLSKYSIEHGDIVIGMSGTIKVARNKADRRYLLNQRVGAIRTDGNRLDKNFLFYMLSNDIEALYKICGNGTVKNLSKIAFLNMDIYLPPLDVQRRIVSILDRFDALCNDLTSGLPAEIAARQKQYEYYRDKLLTFKELTA